MKHPQYLGHDISTEARPVGDRWRGYYRVDEGMFVAVVRISPDERAAHLDARSHAEAAINKIRRSASQSPAHTPTAPAPARAPRRSPAARGR